MDLIYTDANRADRGVLTAYAFDLSFGVEENDFEITIGANRPVLSDGSFAYVEGTEYGGMVSGIKAITNSETVTYKGKTWHGILNNKVIEPDSGEDYLIVSGDANDVLSMLISRLGLSSLFVAAGNLSGVEISNYRFHRYCKAYDGIKAMLAASGAKLKISWIDRAVRLSAEPIADYTESMIDGDVATLTVERYSKKVNHLICLGKGDLAEREVIHLYVDQFGRIGDVQFYTGIEEIAEIYENTNSEDLRKDGINRFEELLDVDKAEISIPEVDVVSYDIGDIVGASEVRSGISVAATVTQKIVRINNGIIRTEYKTGG